MEILFNNKRKPGKTVVEKMREAGVICLAEKGVIMRTLRSACLLYREKKSAR